MCRHRPSTCFAVRCLIPEPLWFAKCCQNAAISATGAPLAHNFTRLNDREKKMATVPMDQREGWIWYNGEMVPWKDATIHVLTHGLHYASSVFEGQRAYGGEVFKL